MTLATSNRVELRFKFENLFAVPVTATACKALRNVSDGLKYSIATDTSKEIRSDRQQSDLIVLGASDGGPVDFELSYGEYDPFIQAALQGTWVAFGVNGVGVAIPTSATFAAGTITAGAATSGASIFTALQPGQFFKVSGSSIPGQNIVAQVSKSVAPTATVLTCEGTPFTGFTGNGGAAVTLSAAQVRNGVTQRSCSIEKVFTDISQFVLHTGLNVNKMTLALASGSMLTGNFEFMGKSATISGTTGLHATVNPSLDFPVMNNVNNISNILENGAPLVNTFLKSMSLDYTNNLRDRDAVASLGNVDIGNGTIGATGSISVYFAEGTLYQKFINNTKSSLSFRAIDSLGNGYVITYPNIKYSDGDIVSGGLDSDCMVNMPFTALRDPVTGSTIIIDRVGAAVVPVT